MKTARSNRCSAFTLVELLIVVGIIAVLIAMLLPALSKVREQGRQVACMANLRQLGAAMIAYAADNDGYLPATARNQPDKSAPAYPANDWLFWQSNLNRGPAAYPNGDEINHSALGKYLGLNPTSLSVLRCPSDDAAARPAVSTTMAQTVGTYTFSYVMNWLIASDSSYISQSKPPYTPPYPQPCQSLHKVLNPSQKALMYEEDIVSIDDGEGMAFAGCASYNPANPDPSTWGQFGQVNLLSLRHDLQNDIQKTTKTGAELDSAAGGWATAVPNSNGQGNVIFCDGHADFVTRAFLHRPDHAVGSQY